MDINTEKIDKDILEKLEEYPYSFENIIDCVLRTQDELNDAFNEKINNWAWTHPVNDSTEWGCLYEREVRRRMNKLGDLTFVAGDHNTGEDLTCVENPDLSIEMKTTQSYQFWNTNSKSRKNKSTKYIDPDKKTFYIMIQHKVEEYGEYSVRTTVKKIWIGMLSKNDWKNPQGGGASYLKANVRDKNCIMIYNSK